jgi:hypothetical protein
MVNGPLFNRASDFQYRKNDVRSSIHMDELVKGVRDEKGNSIDPPVHGLAWKRLSAN